MRGEGEPGNEATASPWCGKQVPPGEVEAGAMVQLDQVVQVLGGGTEVEKKVQPAGTILAANAEGPYRGEELLFGAGRSLQP